MDKYLKYTSSPKPLRNRLKKTYWNQELYDLWVKMSMPEKEFSRYNFHHHIKERLQQKYNYDRSIFDRELRQAERKYYQNMLERLESIITHNPREFWAQM